MTRTPILAGNWKMNVNHLDAVTLVQDLGQALAEAGYDKSKACLLYTSPSPRDRQKSRMPSSA